MYMLKVELPNKTYEIQIEKGLLNSIGERLKYLTSSNKIAIITDKNVRRIYGDMLNMSLEKQGFVTKIVVINPGEPSKSLRTAEEIYNELLDFGINRADLIIAFGGGVVGDLGGFVASTFLRGIPFIQIPTSLLAQVDSSVGGKVAVNLTRGKNLVGSFYHPEAVFIDTDFLQTLEKRHLYDGMAEVIKYGCIKDKKLFDDLLQYELQEDLFENLEKIVFTCCSIKKEIVRRDEKDLGERMMLNFGHTIGHGIEKYFNYSRYTHGEAVAIGMYNITKRSEEMGLTEKGTSESLKHILRKYKLPYEMPQLDKAELIEAIKLDKKNTKENLNIVLLKTIGKGFIHKIKTDEIHKLV